MPPGWDSSPVLGGQKPPTQIRGAETQVELSWSTFMALSICCLVSETPSRRRLDPEAVR